MYCPGYSSVPAARLARQDGARCLCFHQCLPDSDHCGASSRLRYGPLWRCGDCLCHTNGLRAPGVMVSAYLSKLIRQERIFVAIAGGWIVLCALVLVDLQIGNRLYFPTVT